MVLDGLCRVVAARSAGNGLPGALILLVYNRLRRFEREVLVLIAAIRAGRVVLSGPGFGGSGGGFAVAWDAVAARVCLVVWAGAV